MAIDFEKRVEQYVALRDKIKEIEAADKEKLKPFKDILEKLNLVMLSHLDAVGADNIGTKCGTVYRTAKESASIADASAFWTWVVTQGEFDMIDKRANPTAVKAYIEQHHAPPPGVNFSRRYVVGVQRKS